MKGEEGCNQISTSTVVLFAPCMGGRQTYLDIQLAIQQHIARLQVSVHTFTQQREHTQSGDRQWFAGRTPSC